MTSGSSQVPTGGSSRVPAEAARRLTLAAVIITPLCVVLALRATAGRGNYTLAPTT